MKHKFAIIGGDLRIIKLVEMLANEENEIYVYGLEKADDIKNKQNIIHCDSIKKAIQNVEIVIGPIPFSSNGITINAPFSEKDITVMNCEKTLMARIIRAGIVTIYDFTEPFS